MILSVENLFYLVTMLAPFFSALYCLILVFFSFGRSLGIPDGTRIVMLLYFISVMINWATFMFYFYFPQYFASLIPIFYLCVLLIPIYSCHLVYFFARPDISRSFPLYHYILPILLFVILFIWWQFVPAEVSMRLTDRKLTAPTGYEAFTGYFNSLGMFRLLLSAFYTGLALFYVYRYNRTVGKSGQNNWMRWLKALVLLSVVSTLIPLVVVMWMGLHTSSFHISPLLILLVLAVIYQHLLLTYNILAGNFPAYLHKGVQTTDETHGDIAPKETLSKDIPLKKRFELYFEKNKPYTDPDLTINDLTRPLHASRNTLSAFINRTYGVNFSRYINKCRLEEYQSLRSDPANRQIKNLELLQRAGFSTYKNYQRARQYAQEDVKQ